MIKAIIEYSSDIKNVCSSINDCNPNKKFKILIPFNDMINEMIRNKKFEPIVTELPTRDRILKISNFFNTQ